MSLIIFILILVALIWVHELGHFSAAKFFNVRVDEFAIGFPPRLLKVRLGETLYSFNLLLIGGFVRIYGENPGNGAGDPRALSSQKRPVQVFVVVAGILFNILFAAFALSAGYMAGLPASAQQEGFGTVQGAQVTVVGVYPNSPAAQGGITEGDVIVRIDSAQDSLDVRTLSTNRQSSAVQNFIAEHAESSLVVTVSRQGTEQSFLAKPEEGIVDGKKALGVQLDDVGVLRLPPHLAVAQGTYMTYKMTVATSLGLGTFFAQLFAGVADWNSVAGPIGIAGVGAQAVDSGFASVVVLTALISINLALINLLPIPGLDGGRLLIIAIEGTLRRPIPQRLSLSLMLAGFALILSLIVVVSYNDIARLIG